MQRVQSSYGKLYTKHLAALVIIDFVLHQLHPPLPHNTPLCTCKYKIQANKRNATPVRVLCSTL